MLTSDGDSSGFDVKFDVCDVCDVLAGGGLVRVYVLYLCSWSWHMGPILKRTNHTIV